MEQVYSGICKLGQLLYQTLELPSHNNTIIISFIINFEVGRFEPPNPAAISVLWSLFTSGQCLPKQKSACVQRAVGISKVTQG